MSYFKEYKKELEKQLANEIFNQSQVWVPVDTGTLKENGAVIEDGDGYTVMYDTLGARIKGTDKVSRKDYAPYVENIDHYNHKPPTKAHFLRDSVITVLNNHGIKYGEGYTF